MTRKKKESIIAIAFILPSLIGIVLFYIVPYIMCIQRSLFIGENFVGIQNYVELFNNNTFLLALKNTGVFTVLAIPLLMIISFAIAWFLNSFNKISSFFKSSLLFPVIIPVASLICVWQLMFDDYGAINGLLNYLGLSTIDFFNSEYSMLMIILIYIWKYCGFCTIVFTAALANVSLTYYESARLDGANTFQIIRKITLPNIMPTTFFVFIIEIIYSFKIFREVFSIFGNYPNENVYFLQNFINNNYYNLNYPRLSSASIILSVFIILMLIVFYFFERKYSR